MADTTKTIYTRIAPLSYTSAEWAASNPTLYPGELGYDTTVGKFKLGDGSTAWSGISFLPVSSLAAAQNGTDLSYVTTGEKYTWNNPAVMTGAGASSAGAAGIVPAPASGQNLSFLRGDGTWQAPGTGLMTGYTATEGGPVVSTDTLLAAIAKLEARLADLEIETNFYGFEDGNYGFN